MRGASAVAAIATVATLLVALAACSGGSDGGATVTDAGAGAGAGDDGSGDEAPDTGDAGDTGGPAAPSPTEGGDGVVPLVRRVDVPCPAQLEYLTSRSGRSCYQLSGSGGLGTDVIESASVELAGGYWQIQLVLTDAGLARFNRLAAQCIADTPTCPTGRVAFVADRAVVSTTTITKPGYEADEVAVTGRFTADEARTIAEALDP
jgi:hypothetical protein